MADDIQIEGLQELERKLLEIESKAGEKELRKALSFSVNPVVKAAKERVPVKTGGLRQAISKFLRKGKNKNVASVFVGIREKNAKAVSLANQGRSKPIRGVFYGHIVEKGYGRQSPQPFLRPALDQEATNVVKRFRDKLKENIDRVTRV